MLGLNGGVLRHFWLLSKIKRNIFWGAKDAIRKDQLKKTGPTYQVCAHEGLTFWRKKVTQNGQISRPAETDPYMLKTNASDLLLPPGGAVEVVIFYSVHNTHTTTISTPPTLYTLLRTL